MLEIKINTKNLIDSSYSESTKSAFIFEDEEFLQQIVQELKNAHPSVFLVSGYRGVGKTSFVARIAEKLKADHLLASINVAKYEGYPHLVKRLTRQLYLSFEEYPQKKTIDESLAKDFSLLYDRTFNDIANSQFSTTKEETKIEQSLTLSLKKLFTPILVTIATIINVALDLIPSKVLSTMLAFGGLIWSVITTWSIAIKRTSTDTKATESSKKSLYDNEIAEHHLLEILKRLHNENVKVLIAFDELDKHDNIADVMRIIDDLKPLLLSGKANFFIIAGQQLNYHYEEAATKENEVISSIFSKTIHIPFLSHATLKSYCLNLLVNENDRKNDLVLDFLDSLILQSRRIPRILVNIIRSKLQWQNNEAYLILDEVKGAENSTNTKLLNSLTNITDRSLPKISKTPAQLDFFIAQIYIWVHKMIEYRSTNFLLSEIKDIDSYKEKVPKYYIAQLDDLGEYLTGELFEKELLELKHSDDEEKESYYYWKALNEAPIEYRESTEQTFPQVINSGNFITEFAEIEQLCRRIYNEISTHEKQNIPLIEVLRTFKSQGIIDQKRIDLAQGIIETRNLIVHGEKVGNEAIELANQSIFNLRRLKAEILEDYVFSISEKTLLNYSLHRDNRDNFDFTAEASNSTIVVDIKYRKIGSPNASDIINAFRNFENFTKVSSYKAKYILFFFVAGESSYSKLYATVRRILNNNFPTLKGIANIVYISESFDQPLKKIVTETLLEHAIVPDSPKVSDFNFFDQNAVKENIYDEFLQYVQHYFLFEALYSHSLENDSIIDQNLLYIKQNNVHSNSENIALLWQLSYKLLRNIDIVQNKIDPNEHSNLELIRSYIYYVMIGLWGNVPFLKSSEEPLTNYAPSRISAEQIRDTNIDRLKNLLNNTEENTANFIQMASMIAKYYLEKKDYFAVSHYASLIMKLPTFMLATIDEVFETDKESIIGYNLKKYSKIKNDSFSRLCKKGKYVHVVRNTEIVLMAAEASFYLGNHTDAMMHINSIRKRNNKTPINNTSDNFTTLLISEWLENLSCEGSYFFALKRNGIATEKLNIESFKLLLPIPQQELSVNPNMTQNMRY